MAEETEKLVAVRFLTSRASLSGVHYGGIVYEVPPPFAAQVVELEHVAEYVKAEGRRRGRGAS